LHYWPSGFGNYAQILKGSGKKQSSLDMVTRGTWFKENFQNNLDGGRILRQTTVKATIGSSTTYLGKSEMGKNKF